MEVDRNLQENERIGSDIIEKWSLLLLYRNLKIPDRLCSCKFDREDTSNGITEY